MNQQVYRVLECILKTNNFENLSYLGMTEEELLLALKEIEKAVKEEHILQAPPVTGMVYYAQQKLTIQKLVHNRKGGLFTQESE